MANASSTAQPTAVPIQPLSDGQIRTLMAPLNQNRISHRKQGGSSLSYLEAWDVKATLIRVFGFGGFSAECIETDVFDIRNPDPNNDKKFAVSARCTVRLTIHQLGVVFTESAASSQVGSQGIGDVADFAIKTAESDALKRAAIYLGTQFGLSLYNNGSTQEVIRVIMAPGQEWFNGQRMNAPTAPAAVGSIDPAAAANAQTEPVAQEQMSPPEDQPAVGEGSQEQPVVQMPQGQQPPVQNQEQQPPVTDPTQIRHNTTDEEHAANQALLARALNAQPLDPQTGQPINQTGQ